MQIIIYSNDNSNYKCLHSPFCIFGGSEGKRRLALVKQLHRQADKKGTLKLYEANINMNENDCSLLEEASLIENINGKFIPKFFIALEEELLFAKNIALELAIGLVNPLKDWYTELRNLCSNLSISQHFTWAELNFLMVGSFIFELGLHCIANNGEKCFLTPPPTRKGGLYFLLAIETNSLEMFGRYRNFVLKLGGYSIGAYGEPQEQGLPFGVYPFIKKFGVGEAQDYIASILSSYEEIYKDKTNISKELFPIMYSLLLVDKAGKPLVPICSPQDCHCINNLSKFISTNIGLSFDNYHGMLQETFLSFQASHYTCFSEFYCWFFRLIANNALNILIKQGLINLPANGFTPYILKNHLDFPS